MGGHILPQPGECDWTIRLRPRRALCQITLTTDIFRHAHLDIRTDSRALPAEYCIIGIPRNTAI